MNFPTRYSELTPKQRGIVGYLTTVSSIVSIGLFYTEILFALMYGLILIIIGGFISQSFSNYYLSFSVGSSMMPTVPLGLTIDVGKKDFNNIEVGDVVAYDSNYHNNGVHHRIIEKNSYGYKLKGDGNDISDGEIVTEDQIEHKSLQYGIQPIYIPVSPLAIIMTVLKIYKKLRGEHDLIIEESINIK